MRAPGKCTQSSVNERLMNVHVHAEALASLMSKREAGF
jgi:hypothetical protein